MRKILYAFECLVLLFAVLGLKFETYAIIAYRYIVILQTHLLRYSVMLQTRLLRMASNLEMKNMY